MNLVRKDASATNTTGEIPAGGLPIGTLVPSQNIVGRTDGVTPAAGMIGQIFDSSVVSKTCVNSLTAITSLTLPAGTYILTGMYSVNGGAAAGYVCLRTSVAVGINGFDTALWSCPASGYSNATISYPVTTTGATYYLSSLDGQTIGNASGRITAVRIA